MLNSASIKCAKRVHDLIYSEGSWGRGVRAQGL